MTKHASVRTRSADLGRPADEWPPTAIERLLDGEPKRPVNPELVGHFLNMRGGREQRDNGDDESEKAKSVHEELVRRDCAGDKPRHEEILIENGKLAQMVNRTGKSPVSVTAL